MVHTLPGVCDVCIPDFVHSSGGVAVVQLLSHVQVFATPWTVACQAPLSMGFPRQECWSWLPFPSPEDLPDPGIEPRSPALQADDLPTGSQHTVNNSSRDGNTRPLYLPPDKSVCRSRSWNQSRFQGEISITSDMQMTTPLWQKVKKS